MFCSVHQFSAELRSLPFHVPKSHKSPSSIATRLPFFLYHPTAFFFLFLLPACPFFAVDTMAPSDDVSWTLIEAAKNVDVPTLQKLLVAGVDVNYKRAVAETGWNGSLALFQPAN